MAAAVGTQTPEWLKKRGGEVKANIEGTAWTVYLKGEPLYLLLPTPARGKFACRITQTNNGNRLDQGDVYDTPAAALAGGLEKLRAVLGW